MAAEKAGLSQDYEVCFKVRNNAGIIGLKRPGLRPRSIHIG